MRKYELKDGIHYSSDPNKLKIAVEKSRKTIFEKYGENGLAEKIRQTQKNWYQQQKLVIESLEILPKDEVVKFLKNKKDLYTGKSGNRKLMKESPQIFKSLDYYCEEFKKYNNYKEIPFVAKLDLANKNFEICDDMLCHCNSIIKFNKVSQKWDKFYCWKCRKSPTSLEHFKIKYGNDWEIKWREFRENLPVPRGKNETELLDYLEKLYGILIQRDFTIMEFFPDGYCESTNTIYEVNEKHHRIPSHRKKDAQRRHMIQRELKCDFVVIWDDTMEIEIYNYDSKKY